MKVRTGFVSNSSSSSFIIGIGKVKNVEKLVAEVKKLKLYDTDVLIKTFGDFLTETFWDIHNRGSYLSVEAFDGSEVFLRTDVLKNDDYVVILNGIGPHDDSDFWTGDEYDYDIDVTMTPELEAMEKLLYDSSLVEYVEVRRGAGRDG